MALDKLVDSTQLDSDLTSVANAIRAKSGGSSQLAFPAGFVSEIQAIPSGGGDQTISFLDWVQQGCNNNGAFQTTTSRIACKHMLFRCKSISIPSGVQLALGAATMPTINNTVAATSEFVGFWNGNAYTTSFTWFDAPTFDLTQILHWSDNYVVMFLRHQNNSTVQPSEGNPVVVTYDLADGAFVR